MIELFDDVGRIPDQVFQPFYKNIQCHSRGEEQTVFVSLPLAVRSEMTAEHAHELGVQPPNTPASRRDWLLRLLAHIEEEETAVWEHGVSLAPTQRCAGKVTSTLQAAEDLIAIVGAVADDSLTTPPPASTLDMITS